MEFRFGSGLDSTFVLRAVVTLLLVCGPYETEGTVYCYICHWSNTPDASDDCRPNTFNAAATKTEACQYGCHTLTLLEGNETTMVTRQCAEKTIKENDCREVNMVNNMIKQRHCLCDSNYCNSATPGSSQAAKASLAASAIVILLIHVYDGGRHLWHH